MRTTEHGDHLIKLTRLGAVNYYLVREDDGLATIDTGISGGTEGTIAAAQVKAIAVAG